METKDVIFNHKTIRKYLSKPIDDQLMNEILEAGVRLTLEWLNRRLIRSLTN